MDQTGDQLSYRDNIATHELSLNFVRVEVLLQFLALQNHLCTRY